MNQRRLNQLVKEDRAIASEADNATLRLMEHRSNAVDEVGSAREYAEALGITPRTVNAYVTAHGMWTAEAVHSLTPNETLELARMTEDQQIATKAVAEAEGIGIERTRATRSHQVKRVRDVMREEPDPAKREDVARRYATQVKRTADKEAARRAERTENVARSILTIENKVSAAAMDLRQALYYAQHADLDPEAIEILQESLRAVQHLLDLLNLKIVGDTGVDWQREVDSILASEGGKS